MGDSLFCPCLWVTAQGRPLFPSIISVLFFFSALPKYWSSPLNESFKAVHVNQVSFIHQVWYPRADTYIHTCIHKTRLERKKKNKNKNKKPTVYLHCVCVDGGVVNTLGPPLYTVLSTRFNLMSSSQHILLWRLWQLNSLTNTARGSKQLQRCRKCHTDILQG